jgi:hypothetical protein
MLWADSAPGIDRSSIATKREGNLFYEKNRPSPLASMAAAGERCCFGFVGGLRVANGTFFQQRFQ